VTPEQVKNMRNALALEFGAMVDMLTDEEIVKIKDAIQRKLLLQSMKDRWQAHTEERAKKKEKAKRKGLCKHHVAAKHCRLCD